MDVWVATSSFKALADDLPLIVFVTDPQGQALYCNRRLQTFTGLTEAALLGGGWLLAIHEDDREATSAAWREALAAEEPYEIQHRLRVADGHYQWMLVRCVPARSNGHIDHWIGTAVDVHDQTLETQNAVAGQIKAEEALGESEARYRTVFQTMFNFIGLLTTDGILLEANDAALEFGGVTAAEVVGRKFWDTPWWDVGEDAKMKLRGAIAAAAAGEFVRYDATVRVPDGGTAIVDFTLKPVVDPTSGRVLHLIPEGRDLTHLKAVETALRGSQARLQRISSA